MLKDDEHWAFWPFSDSNQCCLNHRKVDSEEMFSTSIWTFFLFITTNSIVGGVKDIWKDVVCDEYIFPDHCNFERIPYITVEDYERCAPAKLPLFARNYYLGWSGRGITYSDNKEAFQRIKIIPKMLRDISKNSLEISTLGQKISFPVGISPTAFHRLANPQGEIATAAAASAMKTIMIVSNVASISLEEIAAATRYSAILWMQLFIFKDRNVTIDIIRRAERSHFKAIVLTVDYSVVPKVLCDAKFSTQIRSMKAPNIPGSLSNIQVAVNTFNDIKWLRTITKLPIVAKGILSGDDARQAIYAGASAILVSNHGGRQLDGSPASIDVLPEVVKTVNRLRPRRDVYLDGGIRNGWDVYKALARGAKMVFVGRPALWGLTMEGADGVKKVLNILKEEFNMTMLLAGATNPSEIRGDTLVQSTPIFG